MSAFWVTFSQGPRAMCIEGKNEAAVRERAKSVGVVATVSALPYPSRPRLEPFETYDDQGTPRAIPEFCYKPRQCAGHTCCPQRYSCTE